MAVIAQTGVFSFGPQVAKGTAATNYYQHRASDIDLGTISDDRLGPPEVGGINTPTIPYRAGVMAAGGATINPRLESTLGWLFYGALGAVATTADKDVLGTTVTGMYNHEFTFATDAGYLPWMTFRKWIPGKTSGDELGEIFRDCKLTGLTVALPNEGLINARVDALGTAEGDNFDPGATWTYANTTMEDYPSIPIGCTVGGYLKIPGYSASALPVTAATITLQNAPLDPRQERNYGSPYLDDVTIVSRQLTIDMVVKWQNPELYESIYTGATNATAWTPSPFVEDLDVYALSPQNAPLLTSPYGLRIRADKVVWSSPQPIRLAGGQAISIRLTGTAIAGGTYYCKFNIGNKTTQYVWPT